MTVYLTVVEVLAIHDDLIARYGGAQNRPSTSLTVCMKREASRSVGWSPGFVRT
jgi:hypothetical protein